MKFRLIFPLILLLIFLGCNKDGIKNDTTFQGLVIDYESGTPRINATVLLNRFDGLSGIMPDQIINFIKDSTLTNENGRYSFNFEDNDRQLYKVTASENGFIEKRNSQEILARHINYFSANTDTIVIGRAGYLKIDLVNIPDGYDSVFLKCNIDIPLEELNLNSDYNRTTDRLYPQLNDTTIFKKYLYKDNNRVYISWEIIDKHNDNTFSSIVELLPMDTACIPA